MRTINLGLIGFGNVGSAVAGILKERKSYFCNNLGLELNLKRVCEKDISSLKGSVPEKGIFTRDAAKVIDDPQIDILVELMGGIHPAKEYISEALKKGKDVVCANKALLAQEGQELFALAADRRKNIYFEAAVGAGIPIIKALREGLVANKFESIYGILNGTSNFILSKMSCDKCSFSESLKEAKLKGFAERDPSLDIEGIDSAHKLILLTYLCFGRLVRLQDLLVEGISRISPSDITYANELGFQIKLLAIAKKETSGLEVRVHPTLIPAKHLLSSVGGVFNAIYVSSDLAGELLFYGPGAGRMSAASAVVADVVELTQSIKAGLFRPAFNLAPDKSIKRLCSRDEFQSRYYIHFTAVDKPGVLARISGVLGKFGISIASVTQKERRKSKVVPIVMVIHEAKEKQLRAALAAIDRLDAIKEKSVAIRIEDV